MNFQHIRVSSAILRLKTVSLLTVEHHLLCICNRFVVFCCSCYFTGGCVGSRNHCLFWWYLLFQNLALWGAVVMLVDLMARAQEEQPWLSFMSVVAIVFLVCFGIMTFSLLGYHAYLACTGSTTYEGMRSEELWYMKPPTTRGYTTYLPFDFGVCANLRWFCLRSWREPVGHIRLWEPRAYDPEKQTFFSNKYYNCC
eukprot:GCRY01007338.1.p1 GENE.GCRY01007338.1~~GCRY01007338.1.p1  ORF type:complete len:197 (-),score=30.22 GCRY01007338.1:325-915(-)